MSLLAVLLEIVAAKIVKTNYVVIKVIIIHKVVALMKKFINMKW